MLFRRPSDTHDQIGRFPKQPRICLIHPFDPRGSTVGGIASYLRDYIALRPEGVELLLVGADGVGNLERGKITQLRFGGRTVDFVPIVSFDKDRTYLSAPTIFRSQTFRFFWALLVHWLGLRRLVRKGGYSIELRRPEYAIFPVSWRVPYIQMFHDGAESARQPMSSIAKRHWWLRRASERFAVASAMRVYGVSGPISDRLRRENPRQHYKIATISPWANARVFVPRPFNTADKMLRLVFAGRMDLFKTPDTMFQVVARVADRVGGRLQFHYIGGGDVEAFPSFAAIRQVTLQHGAQPAAEVAAILAQAHIGILTSEFEGMPRFVLEALSCGRPICALHLAQLEDLVVDGRTGYLLPRTPDMVEKMADRVVDLWRLIENSLLSPPEIANVVRGYRPEIQLAPIFEQHALLKATTRDGRGT